MLVWGCNLGCFCWFYCCFSFMMQPYQFHPKSKWWTKSSNFYLLSSFMWWVKHTHTHKRTNLSSLPSNKKKNTTKFTLKTTRLTDSAFGAASGAFSCVLSALLSSAFSDNSLPTSLSCLFAVAHEQDPVLGAASRLWQLLDFLLFAPELSCIFCGL